MAEIGIVIRSALPVGVPIVIDANGAAWVYLADEGRMTVLDLSGEPVEGGYYAFNLEEGINQMINDGYLPEATR